MNPSRGLLYVGIGFTIFCLLSILAHIVFPDIKIDSITISLLVLSAIPWIIPLIKTLELPGGLKIDFQNTKPMIDLITKEIPTEPKIVNIELAANVKMNQSITANLTTDQTSPFYNIEDAISTSPNLAFVAFRIEIEKRIRKIALQNSINSANRNLSSMIRDLTAAKVLPSSMTEGLLGLVRLGNQAAHGASASKDAAELLIETGPGIIKFLDSLIDSNSSMA